MQDGSSLISSSGAIDKTLIASNGGGVYGERNLSNITNLTAPQPLPAEAPPPVYPVDGLVTLNPDQLTSTASIDATQMQYAPNSPNPTSASTTVRDLISTMALIVVTDGFGTLWQGLSRVMLSSEEVAIPLRQFNSYQSLLKYVEPFEETGKGYLQSEVKGDAESIFNSITENKTSISERGWPQVGNATISNYLSRSINKATEKRVYTIFINVLQEDANVMYKIRVLP